MSPLKEHVCTWNNQTMEKTDFVFNNVLFGEILKTIIRKTLILILL